MKKRLIYNLLGAVLLLISVSACSKTEYTTYDTDYAGIYFTKDSIHYSFSVTPLEIERYLLRIPVKIMGIPSKTERKFKVELITGNTTATAGVQYTKLAEEFIVMPDSINGILPFEIHRSELGDSTWKVGIRLMANSEFQPTYEKQKEIVLTFDNKVLPPDWKGWDGTPTWPDFNLGPWNPLTWIKFMELFRAMEQKVPDTYYTLVEKYGPNLENVEFGWPWDYDYTFTKYVLIPLYDFFESHPEYGVEVGAGGIPKP